MRAGVATSPHFPGAIATPCSTAPFSGRIRFRTRSFDLARFHLGLPIYALRLRQAPGSIIEANFDEIPFAVPSPEGSGSAGLSLESGSGIGLRLCLTLLPSIALPSLAGDHPCECPPLPRWQ